MKDPRFLRYSRLPQVWTSYPRVLLRSRPPVTKVRAPRDIHATVKRVPLDPARVAAYARLCGFPADGELPATYPHVLAMPLHLKIFASEQFPLRPMGLIHLTNVIECLAPLRAGMLLDVHVAARNYRRSDAGLCFDMVTEISAEGQPRWRESCCFMSRWPEPPPVGGSRPPRPPKAPKDAAVLAEFDVSLRMAWDYARVSADFNPIHLNDRAARFFGLRGAIAHGMWSLARSLAATSGGARRAPPPRVDTQFLTPVQLPARVTIKEWTADGQSQRALCDVRTGRVHMYAFWPAQ